MAQKAKSMAQKATKSEATANTYWCDRSWCGRSKSDMKQVQHDEAVITLRKKDKDMRRIIDACGPYALKPKRGHFAALCRAIIGQQLAVAAAATIYERFRKLFPTGRPNPEALLRIREPRLRQAGLSNQKLGYLRDLATHFSNGTIPHRRLNGMSDEEVIVSLTAVKGIGLWTAQMFLIFVLARPDVWPTGDLGIRRALERSFGVSTEASLDDLEQVGEPWRPFRSYAAWYLWRSLDIVPVK
jgi:DNA-3-methyladenine glycosylase II